MQDTPGAGLNPVIHAPHRLKICALLATAAELEFRFLKEELGVSDSVLSKHLKVLESAGYIRLAKRKEFGHLWTWASLAAAGRKAFNGHVKELKRIVGE